MVPEKGSMCSGSGGGERERERQEGRKERKLKLKLKEMTAGLVEMSPTPSWHTGWREHRHVGGMIRNMKYSKYLSSDPGVPWSLSPKWEWGLGRGKGESETAALQGFPWPGYRYCSKGCEN